LVLASTAGDPVAITPAVRAAVLEVSDNVPVSSPISLAGEFWRQGWAFRVFGGLFLTFGLAALLLAGAGLYGVMAFTVRRRTSEIGVRMALGASKRRVLGAIFWQGIWRVALGIAIGIWPGWFVGGLMEALLEDVAPSDPLVHASTVGTLLIAGTLACLVPARRAASVDPIIALRTE
jgi:ABC-type antimicrobial peptide transport system permease subunit